MSKIRSTFLKNLLIALGAMLIIVYLYPHSEASHYKYEKGRPWNYAKLIAPFDIPIKPDSDMINKKRDSLDRFFIPVFTRRPAQGDSVITSLMMQWKRNGNQADVSEQDLLLRRHTISFLQDAYKNDIIDNEYGNRIDDGSLPVIKIYENNTVKQCPTADFRSTDEVYRQLVLALNDSSAQKWANDNQIFDFLQPNIIYDALSSKRLYDNELYHYTAIQGVIQQGQTIIDKGAIVSPQDYTNLLTYEQLLEEQITSNRQNAWFVWLGQLLYVSMLLTVLMVYLCYSVPKVWKRSSSMMFIFLMIVLFFGFGLLGDAFIDYGIYIVPFAIVPVLMIVFFDAPTALFTSLILILLCAGTVTFPLEFIVLQLSATVAAVYSLKDLRQRSQLLRTAALVACGYLLSYLAIELMMNGSLEGFSVRLSIYLLVSAVFSSIAYIIMVVVERSFGFVSSVTLIELSDVNMPLLRQLSEECPGTFQHSMAVSSLATDAAIKIGANEQLVRAGALYHDIGKITNPNFFTENQRGVNPHDALPADRSAQIIIQHVTDGVTRAEKAGLPEIIKDFIREHHGKGKAKYFYYTYCQAHPDEEIDPAPFTYPGPNPQSRETSLLMMADSVEAASRSLKEHTPQAITELVNKIIDSQILEGLHNDSSLSFRDVKIIKEEFIKRLTTMYHSRIQYPDAAVKAPSEPS